MDVSVVPTGEDKELSMLDSDQVNTLNAVERMGATLSLFGIILIFITFALFKRLRTIPNTFIFFASIANIGACVACLIAYDGITAMDRDRDAPLCQAQAFIFEWFMQSDPWWSFAMAINVYMVFFMSFNPAKFRQYLWLYCLICYGLPAIPAFAFLFIHPGDGNPIYGDAVLWCWIASEWNALRIYSYYLPIWVCSVLSAVIYFAVGYHVFHQRNQLRNLSLSNQGKETTGDTSDVRDSAEKNLTSRASPAYYGTVTTEVQVTSAAMSTSPLPAYTNPFLELSSSSAAAAPHCRPSDTPELHITTSVENQDPLHVTTTAPNAPGVHSPVHTHHYPWSKEPSSFFPPQSHQVQAPESPGAATLVNSNSNTTFNFPPPTSPTAVRTAGAHNFESTNHGFNATNYTSISAGSSPKKDSDDRGPSPTRLLSPISTVVADEESGTQRRRSSDSPKDHSNNKTAQMNIFRRMSDGTRRFGARLKHMDPVKLAYLRTSFVFAISILVTWTPSSINRVYTLIYPAQASYGLNIAAAVVLPLQGVWNAVIYFTTSWKIFREEMEGSRAGRRVLSVLGLGSAEARGVRQSGGSFALGSTLRTPRSEMGRSRRLEDEISRDGGGEEGEAVELQSPMSSPVLGRRPQPVRTNTMRVTSKGLDDFH